jgi:F-type H+-transporting ATPase subunit b
MPQLDITSFPTQIFWLFLIFVGLYIFVSNWFIPGMNDIVERRDAKVTSDVAQAEEMVKQHRHLKAEMDLILNEAIDMASKIRTEAATEGENVLKKELKKLEVDLAEKTEAEEEKLRVFEAQYRVELPLIIKDLSQEIYKTALSLTGNESKKIN